VSGAGDAFLVTTALCLASGADIWKAMYVGSVASASQVSRIGNNPLTTEEMLRQLSE
jgi:bifunctional ADP-heptose synthase (sugar kinase/adenylyltransferase)